MRRGSPAARPACCRARARSCCRTSHGNIELTHSVSAGLDYAAVGPEHAWLHERGRAEYHYVSDDEALEGFQTLARTEGILPALESSHAIAYVMKAARRFRQGRGAARQPVGPRRQGRADRREASGGGGTCRELTPRFATCVSEGRTGLVTYVTAGDPDLERSREILVRLDRAGADILEVGVPFSDPLADGPVIQRATERAIAAGATLVKVLGMVSDVRSLVNAPIVIFSYANPILRMGARRVRLARAAGRRRRRADARCPARGIGAVPAGAVTRAH